MANGKYYICLDIGGTKVLGVIFNSKREIVYRVKKKTKAGGDDSQNIENTIISLVEQLISEYKITIKDVAAIAAGAPGVINIEKGIVLFSPNLPWKNYEIKKAIEKDWTDFKVTTRTKGAEVETPPDNGGNNGANPRAAEIAKAFHERRYGAAPAKDGANKTE